MKSDRILCIFCGGRALGSGNFRPGNSSLNRVDNGLVRSITGFVGLAFAGLFGSDLAFI